MASKNTPKANHDTILLVNLTQDIFIWVKFHFIFFPLHNHSYYKGMTWFSNHTLGNYSFSGIILSIIWTKRYTLWNLSHGILIPSMQLWRVTQLVRNCPKTFLQTLVAEDADIIAIQGNKAFSQRSYKKHLEVLEELFPGYETRGALPRACP